MAEVHAILKRLETETNDSFRRRCGEFILYGEFASAVANGAIAVGRMTLIDGRQLDADMKWGQAHDGPLPSDTCVIASYGRQEARGPLYEVDVAQLRRAPVNPPSFPRMAHRMSMDEFGIAIQLVQSTSEEGAPGPAGNKTWTVFLDGRCLGSVTGTELEATLQIHKAEVMTAMRNCTEDRFDPAARLSSLPSPDAMVWHPECVYEFPREAALARQALVWSQDLGAAAQREGWDLFEADGELRIQSDDDSEVLTGDSQAFELVATGTQAHHVLARTILAAKSPSELGRIRQYFEGAKATAHSAREAHC